jgi:hypothetical protein
MNYLGHGWRTAAVPMTSHGAAETTVPRQR